jgi:uncharacterized protein YbjT (DUF2867 family)
MAIVVALVGAAGNLGHRLLPALVSESSISAVHCLSRNAPKDSPSSSKVKYFQVDYTAQDSIKNALKGCDVLINAMGTNLDHLKNKVALVDAAADVGVKVYIPRYICRC